MQFAVIVNISLDSIKKCSLPLYIINSEGIAYYQNEVLYIIKPQGK